MKQKMISDSFLKHRRDTNG